MACAVAMRYGPQNEPLATNLRLFLLTGAWLNLYLMIFNLMPVPPLDGSMILAGFSDRAMYFFSKPGVQQFGLLALFIAVFSTDLSSALVDAIQTASNHAVAIVVTWLPIAS
ncbi:MAG: hypothetical protein EXS17_02895 [Phycisphaerales bacterium]|nr:hypothetical protein [Phycisphaerales bacterium]